MSDGGDVSMTFRWGLRRYAWVVALFMVATGVLAPFLLNRGPDVYEARAQVGPTGALDLPNLDPLPRLGDSVFNNGAVADAVRQSEGLTPSAAVVPQRVELIAAQDNIIFTVVGRGRDPESARDLANLAAAAFTLELNKYSKVTSSNRQPAVGEFAIQRAAETSARPVPRLGSGRLSIGIGVVAGAIGGIGAVALLLVWRRPVVDMTSAEKVTGTPVLGRVRLVGAQETAHDVRGIAPLCRRLLADASGLVLLVGTARTGYERHQLLPAMTRVLSRVRRVRVVPGGELPTARRLAPRQEGRFGGDALAEADFVIVDGPTPSELATRPDASLTLLIVEEGVALASLLRNAEQYLDGGPAGLVLVRRVGWYRRMRSRSRRLRSEVDSTGTPPAAYSRDHPVESVPSN